MIRKPLILVLVFSALFAVLIAIQVYFLKVSYSLKERELISLVKERLNHLEDDVDVFDDDLVRDDEALERFVRLEKGELSEAQVQADYQQLREFVQPRLTQYVDSVFETLGYEIKLKKEINSIYSHNLKKELISRPILVYQTEEMPETLIPLSSGRWETSTHSSSKDKEDGNLISDKSVYYAYSVKRDSFFEFSNMNWILFRDLFGLILVSVFILIAILILFYKSYQNLMEQQRQIENLHDMVDNVSHEMKTPVATLKIVSKSLERKHDPTVLQILARQVERLEGLLRPLTESEQGTEIHYFTPSDLERYLQDFRFAHPGIQIQTQNLPVACLKIEKQDMETILSNLFSNSVKYGAKQIDLRFIRTEGWIKMVLQDNGQGIAKQDQPYIFEKFYRIQKDNIHQTKGMGLGLYIVRKLVQKYQGEISLQSDLMTGSSFQIKIPYAV